MEIGIDSLGPRAVGRWLGRGVDGGGRVSWGRIRGRNTCRLRRRGLAAALVYPCTSVRLLGQSDAGKQAEPTAAYGAFVRKIFLAAAVAILNQRQHFTSDSRSCRAIRRRVLRYNRFRRERRGRSRSRVGQGKPIRYCRCTEALSHVGQRMWVCSPAAALSHLEV